MCDTAAATTVVADAGLAVLFSNSDKDGDPIYELASLSDPKLPTMNPMF